MMSGEFWTSWLAFSLLAGPILLAYVSFFYSLYLSRRHLNSLLGALKGSRHIDATAAGLLQVGWFGKILLVGRITFMVTWPGPGLRAGNLDPDDIQNFPKDLKRLLNVKVILTCVIVIWIAIACVLVKLK